MLGCSKGGAKDGPDWRTPPQRAREHKLRRRRLILVGNYKAHAVERDPDARARLLRKFDGFLMRDQDRELFDLPPRDAEDA